MSWQVLQIDDGPQLMQIKNGARVMLKTSSPPMQVIEVRPDGWLICQWMHDGKLTSKAFPLSAVSYILILCTGWFIFNEAILPLQLLGGTLILAGVWLIGTADYKVKENL